jgi:hypothetical protein
MFYIMRWMKLRRAFEDLFLAIATVLLLFTPSLGGYWWWPLIIVGEIIVLALLCVLRRVRIDQYGVT